MTPQQWRKVVDVWRASGMSKEEFCNRYLFNLSTFKKMVLRFQNVDKTNAQFLARKESQNDTR